LEKLPASLRGSKLGGGIHELALLCLDFLGELVTASTTAILGRASKDYGDKREEDSESDGKTKYHVRQKTAGEHKNNELRGISWLLAVYGSRKKGMGMERLRHIGSYIQGGALIRPFWLT